VRRTLHAEPSIAALLRRWIRAGGAELLQVRDKLYTTRELLHSCLAHPEENLLETLRRGGGYADSQGLLEELTLLYRSLLGTDDDGIANGVVLNAIRRVQTFGCSLMRLDIRQESTRHRDVINALTTYLDLGSFTEWPEEQKVEWLVKELQVCIAQGAPLKEACAPLACACSFLVIRQAAELIAVATVCARPRAGRGASGGHMLAGLIGLLCGRWALRHAVGMWWHVEPAMRRWFVCRASGLCSPRTCR
jgi:Phosphoenolpyruvate carboxylase